MVLGFSSNPVPKLRKSYDRTREKIDKIKDKNQKVQLLRMLDQLEPTLISLEEQEQPKFERRRMISYIRDGVEQVSDLLAEKKEKK
jgi:molecular chaperone GrpE (heat shock protein)